MDIPVDRTTAEKWLLGTDEIIVLATGAQTGGDIFAVEIRMPPGGGPPVMHRHEPSEVYYVVDGEFTFYVGDPDDRVGRRVAHKGDIVPLAGKTPHTIRNETDRDAVAFVVHSPAAVMEGFSRAAAAAGPLAIEDVLSLAERHGVELLGPVPDTAATPVPDKLRSQHGRVGCPAPAMLMPTDVRRHPMTGSDFPVADTNLNQAAAWNGPEGEVWATHAAYYDRTVRDYHRRLLDAASLRADEAVLDVGCGTGEVTCAAAELCSRGSVTGIDLSAAMVEVARGAAVERGLTNVSVVHGDAQLHSFRPAAYDVALSRFGSMFFGDQIAAFANIRRALRDSGRVLLMSWRSAADNEWFREITGALSLGRDLPQPPPAAPSPFRHADPDEVAAILGAAGFSGADIAPVDVPMHFGRTADEAYERMVDLLGWLLEQHDPDDREKARERLRTLMHEHAAGSGVSFGSAAWLIGARAG